MGEDKLMSALTDKQAIIGSAMLIAAAIIGGSVANRYQIAAGGQYALAWRLDRITGEVVACALNGQRVDCRNLQR